MNDLFSKAISLLPSEKRVVSKRHHTSFSNRIKEVITIMLLLNIDGITYEQLKSGYLEQHPDVAIDYEGDEANLLIHLRARRATAVRIRKYLEAMGIKLVRV